MNKASLAQGKQLLELFSDATSEQAQAIIEAGGLLRMMMSGADLGLLDRNAFAELLPFPITIDYSRTLEEMIAAGHYNYINPGIAMGAPAVGRNDAEKAIIHLVHFGRSISSTDAVTELEIRGLRAARLEELLAFGAKYPGMQRMDEPIVAIGTVLACGINEKTLAFGATPDDSYIASLVRTTMGRGLELALSHSSRWINENYRFAAVRM